MSVLREIQSRSAQPLFVGCLKIEREIIRDCRRAYHGEVAVLRLDLAENKGKIAGSNYYFLPVTPFKIEISAEIVAVRLIADSSAHKLHPFIDGYVHAGVITCG